MKAPKPPRPVYNVATEMRHKADITIRLREMLLEPDWSLKQPIQTAPKVKWGNREGLGFSRTIRWKPDAHYLNMVRQAVGLPRIKKSKVSPPGRSPVRTQLSPLGEHPSTRAVGVFRSLWRA